MVKGTADKTFVSPAPVVESQTPNVVKAAVFLATRGIIKARVRMHFILRGVCGWHYSHVLPTTKKKRLLSDIINHIPSQKTQLVIRGTVGGACTVITTILSFAVSSPHQMVLGLTSHRHISIRIHG